MLGKCNTVLSNQYLTFLNQTSLQCLTLDFLVKVPRSHFPAKLQCVDHLRYYHPTGACLTGKITK